MLSRSVIPWPTRTLTGRGGASAMWFAVGAAAIAALVAYAVVEGHRLVATSLALFPLVAWVLVQPLALLVAVGVALPDVRSLTGGRGGFNVSIGDLVLLLAGGAIVAEAAAARRLPAVRALRPVAAPVLQYGAVMALLLLVHFGGRDLAQTGQRFELFLLPLVVGAFAALKGRHIALLKAYVIATTVLAAVWPLNDLAMQKNPVGQLIANAILLLVAVPALRRLLPCLLILVPGLFLTESRGAIIAAAIGLVVIVLMQGFRERSAITRVAALATLAVGVFALMPQSLQERVTTFSASKGSKAAWALYFRDIYTTDAKRIIREHPWTGVGIGNYLEADSFSPLPSDDPHQVVLLQAAEGGYVLAGSFVLLVGAVVLALRRMARTGAAVAVAAAAVLLSTVAHGMVDVYWVRGTPVLGWLLIGMACGELALRRREGAAS